MPSPTIDDVRVHRIADLPTDSPMPMLERKRIMGEKAMISHIVLHQGCVVPSHKHENEQFAFVMSGHVKFGIGDEGSDEHHFVEAKTGEVLYVPSNVAHSAEAIESSELFDVFAPTSETTGIDRGG